ncbi:DNA-binding response regulator [Corticibacter populi]|uniref:DNA-binding response regulator n=1 Tax=Corticibacter populi TaxID=1550736 RepID=A0A3M6QSL0_9BURK|nr:DNA-binding response regulator [Corticibacter populi]
MGTAVAASPVPLRVLVVDDHPRIRDPLAVFLRRHALHVRTAGDAAAMTLWLRHERFDVVVLDVMLPDGDGSQLCAQVRRQHGVPVILLTARDAIDDRVRGLEGGADDYVVKPFDPRELLARLRAVARRGMAAMPTMPAGAAARSAALAAVFPAGLERQRNYRFNGCRFDALQGLLHPAQGRPAVPLSEAQARLLEVLLHHANRVLSRDELLELTRTQGRQGDLAYDRTMDRQISRLRGKLQAAGTAVLRTVRGQGYLLAVHEDVAHG